MIAILQAITSAILIPISIIGEIIDHFRGHGNDYYRDGKSK